MAYIVSLCSKPAERYKTSMYQAANDSFAITSRSGRWLAIES